MYPAGILGLGFNVNPLALPGEDDEEVALFQPAYGGAVCARTCA